MRQGEKGILVGVLAVVLIVVIILVTKHSGTAIMTNEYNDASGSLDQTSTDGIDTTFDGTGSTSTSGTSDAEILSEFGAAGASLDGTNTDAINTDY